MAKQIQQGHAQIDLTHCKISTPPLAFCLHSPLPILNIHLSEAISKRSTTSKACKLTSTSAPTFPSPIAKTKRIQT
uniref:Uncharacterized protein n=1 Tax=Physcomitrium patens TaxID=3218 RepID=A0A2K1L4H7_PHYPA|nr:hypothetical protein PHYPA_003723 [Physcomitrium patens]